jgi:shikimate dehydrogenase
MRVFGLIGYPLGHSFSASFFSEKFRTEGHNAIYRNFELSSLSSLPEIIQSNIELEGLNVTLPFKSEILDYLDDIDPLAEEIGAVNVIRISRAKNSFKLKGFNTDIVGFTRSLKPLLNPDIRSALILGTGGSSLAVMKGLDNAGIEYRKVSRDKEKGDMVYAELDKNTLRSFPLIINTTPLGMFPEIEGAPALPYDGLTAKNVLFDLVYNPELSNFLSLGIKQGCKVKGGLEMLYIQAEEAWALWNTRD